MSEKTQRPDLNQDDVQQLANLKAKYDDLRAEIGKIIIGQDEVVEQLLMSIFARGHCILEGVPGLAKTLLVSTLADCTKMSFNRIQFTPDLMPSDITGTDILQVDKETGERVFQFYQGPIFANIILADEINRTPPKTQAALLEAMQERQVTVGGRRMPMENPFFVLATQNPIEQEGTYPLPEAQQDRFMFKVIVGYPSYDIEYKIAEVTTSNVEASVESVVSTEELLPLQSLIRRVPAAPHVIDYALRIVRATRVTEDEAPDFVKDLVSWGAGPRAVQYLLLGGKARAALNGRPFVSADDIRSVAKPVLRHRIVTTYAAESEGVTPDTVIDRLIETTSEKSNTHPDATKALS